MSAQIPVLSDAPAESNSPPSFGALPTPTQKTQRYVEEYVSSDEVRRKLFEICEEFKLETVDPERKLGIEEIELALVISGRVGVKLIGEVQTGLEASVKVKIKRR